MSIQDITEEVVIQLSKGKEDSFSLIYDSYYTYLNLIAIRFVFDKYAANQIVNDVFINVWNKRTTLTYPIHNYLLQSVKNGCLNYIRSKNSKERMLSEHKKQMLEFHEEYIFSIDTPAHYLTYKEAERAAAEAIEELPAKCRLIFEQYFYVGKTADEIAEEFSISSSTVRVQVKNALDRLRISLRYLLGLLIIFRF